MDGMQTQDQNCFRFAFVIIVIKERARTVHKLETSQSSNLDESSHLEIFETYEHLYFHFLQAQKQENIKMKSNNKRIFHL